MKSRTDSRSPMVEAVCSVPRGSMTAISFGISNAASGISCVMTRSPAVACSAMYSSAISEPPSTRTVVTSGEPGGVWSRIFDTRMVSMPNRLAARKTMSFTGRGAASASIQIFKVGSRRISVRDQVDLNHVIQPDQKFWTRWLLTSRSFCSLQPLRDGKVALCASGTAETRVA